ncbi:MAG: Ig-like domain-containing protein [Jatrophihabitans sp.]|uniref:Ig-like domain-containing protein n=1 Tax=Jatrophihabitans sp. TaxID=1932789 RepID=UPI003F811F32
MTSRRLIAVALFVPVLAVGGTAAGAASKPRATTTPPTVSIANPATGATVSGVVAVNGTASSKIGIASVGVSVDGGATQTASGTTTWSTSWSSAAVANGSHTLTVTATDTSGVRTTVSRSVIVQNADATPPTISVSAPTSGSAVAGTVAVTGTAADNTTVASVQVSVDGGAWQTATGTGSWTWTWDSTAIADGGHTVTARASDMSGNTAAMSVSVTVANAGPAVNVSAPAAGSTVSGTVAVSGTASSGAAISHVDLSVDGGTWQPATGTASWSWSWNTTRITNGAHTVATRVTDALTRTATTTQTVTVSNPTAASAAPASQGSWVSPEGVTINVNSAGPWTVAQIYSILQANALDLGAIGPHLTINVQDQYTSQTQASYGSSYKATMWLQGANSAFASRPDDILTHEYGHAWSLYWYYTAHGGSWAGYRQARWTAADGSTTLATDSRTDSSYNWQTTEIVADDYRLLFGDSAAISERPTHLNSTIPDPRDEPGLRDYLFSTWRTP